MKKKIDVIYRSQRWKIRALEYVGKTFNYLTIVEILPPKNGKTFVKCICKCGKERICRLRVVKNGEIKNCGCIRKKFISVGNRKHGDSKTYIYGVWLGIKSRCYNTNNKNYSDYGGRGITVCSEWMNSYEVFKDWALKNGYSVGLQIDREKNNLGYSPENCRFVTRKVNCNNKRSNRNLEFRGEIKNVSEWATFLNISYSTISNRINFLNWEVEKALTLPIKKRKYANIENK